MNGLNGINPFNNNNNMQALTAIQPIKTSGGQSAGKSEGAGQQKGSIFTPNYAQFSELTPNYGSGGMNVNGGVAGSKLNLMG
ncbi:hypothetical protein KBA27_06905 [bacterium]|nr:hypothetical protein [bacterium]